MTPEQRILGADAHIQLVAHWLLDLVPPFSSTAASLGCVVRFQKKFVMGYSITGAEKWALL